MYAHIKTNEPKHMCSKCQNVGSSHTGAFAHKTLDKVLKFPSLSIHTNLDLNRSPNFITFPQIRTADRRPCEKRTWPQPVVHPSINNNSLVCQKCFSLYVIQSMVLAFCIHRQKSCLRLSRPGKVYTMPTSPMPLCKTNVNKIMK